LLTTFFLISFILPEYLLEITLRTENASAGQKSGRKRGYRHCGGACSLRGSVSGGFSVSIANPAITAPLIIPSGRRPKQFPNEPASRPCIPRGSN
jgi:hypothetical protein